VIRSGVTIGEGGWMRINGTTRAGSRPFVLVRFREDHRGELRACEYYVDGGEGVVTDHLLDSVSVRELEDLVNYDDDLNERLRRRLHVLAVDLRRPARFYSTTFGGGSFGADGRGKHWAAELWATQAPSIQPKVPQAPVPSESITSDTTQLTKADCRIRLPDTRKYPDEFYARVALLYRRLVARGQPPAALLASANGVPATTAHRWIKEARRRRILEPAWSPGRAG
jgi:hypothetical protein